jgi:hypothetical protein
MEMWYKSFSLLSCGIVYNAFFCVLRGYPVSVMFDPCGNGFSHHGQRIVSLIDIPISWRRRVHMALTHWT